MSVKMIQDIGNKLEARIDKLQETLSKEIQNLRIKQAEMQKYNNWNKEFIRSNQKQIMGGKRMNKWGGGEASGNYWCGTEKKTDWKEMKTI